GAARGNLHRATRSPHAGIPQGIHGRPPVVGLLVRPRSDRIHTVRSGGRLSRQGPVRSMPHRALLSAVVPPQAAVSAVRTSPTFNGAGVSASGLPRAAIWAGLGLSPWNGSTSVLATLL